MSDLYTILGVDRSVDDKALRNAYRKLARQNHPDVRPDDPEAEERFKRASHAYSVISDPERRRLYDEFGEASLAAGFDGEAARRARQFGGGFGGFATRGEGSGDGVSFEDLIGGLFQRNGDRHRVRPPGPDLRAEVVLDFVNAARGAEQRIQVARPTASGEIKSCRLLVRIPAGVRDGGRIRLAGKGGESRDGPPGDLWLDVRVRPHPVFRRKRQNLHLDLPVTVREATLGAEVPVPTLEGRAMVVVPPGTQGGSKLRLRGKGIPAHARHRAGDLIATVRIRIPRDLDEAGREALEALDACESDDPRAALFR